ncbi:MAG: PAS-domain containing protein [Sphingomicrobium sp.]
MRSGSLNWVLLVLGLAWLVVTAAIAIMAARQLRRARQIVATAREAAQLLDRAPARPLLVKPGGAIEADRRLLRDLGIDGQPQQLGDLGGTTSGIDGDDLEALSAAIDGARLAGETFSQRVRTAGSSRVFEVRGGPAPSGAEAGTLLLWFLDSTGAEEERATVALRLKQTDSALNSLTQLIEAAPFPMWYRGPDLKLGLVNSAYVHAVEGSDAADVIARGSELVEGISENAEALAQQALDTGRVQNAMQPAIIRGERRMLRMVEVPLATGAVAGFAIDVQDLEDARGDLARYMESQRELADRMTAGTAQFDSERNLSFFNQPFAKMTALDPEWLSDGPEFDRVIELMRDNQRLPEARDFPAWKEERRDWFTSPEEVIEEEWMLANGDHLRVVAQPLPDGGLRLFLEDRTEQLRLASARDTLLRVRAATFDNLFEAISVFASDGRLYLYNRRFIEDWELDETWLTTHPRVDELVPVMARKLVNPTAAAQIRETVRHTTNERQSSSGRIAMTDGRNFQYAAVPLPDGNALLTIVDVTDSSRIEASLRERATALEKADKVKTDFVANMSYELRTPLTSIGGFAELLGGGYAGELTAKGMEYVDAILQSVDRLTKLINHVLDLTTGDQGGIVLEKERIDVAGLARAVVEAMRERAADNGQKLIAAIEPSAGTIFGDARRLRESIEHVLNNAMAFTDRGGRIDMHVGGDADQAVITIADNGAGISEADLPRVFNRFDRVVEGKERTENSLGLGLPLTRQFIEAHGGTVDLQSVEGKGTAVTLSLPRGRK